MSDAGTGSGPNEGWPTPPPSPGGTPPPPPGGTPPPPAPPGGSPSVPAPGYGYGGPAYGTPQYGAPGYGVPVQQGPKTSGLAIASLVLGVLWICGVGSLIAVVLGAVALGGIKKSKGMLTGKGMAIAGLVLGVLGLLGTATFWIVAVTQADDVGDELVDFACDLERDLIQNAIDNFEEANGRPPADEQELIDANLLFSDSDDFDVDDGRIIARGNCD
jgi:hypothetical protein